MAARHRVPTTAMALVERLSLLAKLHAPNRTKCSLSKKFLKVGPIRIVLTFSEEAPKHEHFDLEMAATFRNFLEDLTHV
jgi:hypothetical protein